MSEKKHDVMPGDTVCPTCGREFNSHNGMKTHHAQIHGVSISGYWIDCDWCGKTHHKRQLKQRNDHEFCSKSCYSEYQSNELSGENSHMWEGKTVVVECDWCGEDTEKKIVNLKKNEKKFCSVACHGNWISENNTGKNNPQFDPSLTVECHWCGKEHQKSQMKIERNKRHFCSNDCRGEWQSDYRRGENHPRWKEPVTVQCSWCDESITRRPSVVQRNDDFFCSSECESLWMSHNLQGKNHPHWKGGVNGDYGANWKEQRRCRLEKDGYKCVVCGMSNGEHREQYEVGLHVHHIQRKESFRRDSGSLDYERANRIENLITLCYNCHGRWEGIPLKPQVDA